VARFKLPTRIALRALLATVIPLALLEAGLRVGASIARRIAASRAGPAATDGKRVVLCVGDSYTYGVGASDASHSYPGRLECRLDATTGSSWRVVDCGVPGQDSADVLRALPGQLATHSPEIVCILVGTNNRWSVPDAGPTDADAGDDAPAGPRSELRIVRLAKVVLDRFRTRDDAKPASARRGPGPPPFVGCWYERDDRVLRFDPDGRAFVRGVDGRWTCGGHRLRLVTTDGRVATIEWAMAGARLRLVSDGAPPVECERAAVRWTSREPDCSAPDAESGAALDLLYHGEFDAAKAALVPLLPRHAESAALHLGLAQTFGHFGEREAAAVHVAWLERRYSAHPTKDMAEYCGWAVDAAVMGAAGLAELERLAADHPESASLHRSLAERARALGDTAHATREIDRAIALARGRDPILLAELLRQRSEIVVQSAPRQALADALESYSIDGDRGATLHDLRLLLGGQPVDEVVGWAEQLERDDDVRRAQLVGLVRAADGDFAALASVLSVHLARIVALCRRRGAQPLFVGYPFDAEYVDEAFESVARAMAVPYVRNAARFDDEVTRRPREELFISDGHCTDAGYDLLAGAVAEEARRLATR
jgi:lysophospholipase L1-like esterase